MWLPYWAKKLTNMGFGSGKTYWNVWSSIITTLPPRMGRKVTGDISGSMWTWLKRNMKSSEVRGWPSDHFSPLRSVMVVTRPSSERLHDSARFGSTLRMSAERVRACSQLKNCQVSQSVMRAVPPYLPTL